MNPTKDTFFKPEKVSPQDKAATTNSVARTLIEAEAVARERKTEALRALRLQREAVAAEAETSAAPKKRAKAAARK